jgi:hypothetical protein
MEGVGFPLVAPGGVGYLELRAKEARMIELVLDAESPGGREQVLRVSDEQTEVPFTLHGRSSLSVRVAVPEGTSRLLVKTDPAATSTDDAITVFSPHAEAASGEPQLHAEPVSSDPGF